MSPSEGCCNTDSLVPVECQFQILERPATLQPIMLEQSCSSQLPLKGGFSSLACIEEPLSIKLELEEYMKKWGLLFLIFEFILQCYLLQVDILLIHEFTIYIVHGDLS